MSTDPVSELRRLLESSPLPQRQRDALCAKWRRDTKAALKRVKLRQLAREIAAPSKRRASAR